MTYPVEVERSKDNIFWRLEDGTYFATKLDIKLPVPVQSGGYKCLEALKKLKSSALWG